MQGKLILRILTVKQSKTKNKTKKQKTNLSFPTSSAATDSTSCVNLGQSDLMEDWGCVQETYHTCYNKMSY